MSLPKLFILVTVLLFGSITIVGVLKKNKDSQQGEAYTTAPYELEIEMEVDETAAVAVVESNEPEEEFSAEEVIDADHLPDADRISELYNVYEPKLPIVETLTYKSKVDWQPGRSAWISDYARHYETSRHFIARSLNGKPDYLKQNVSPGDRFNVLKKDKNLNFHLVVDILSNRMWFYYHDLDTNDRVLLRTYQVGLGRVDKSRASGLLTPLGKYSLGSKIAIYKPKTYSYHNGEKVEMIRIFGTRWIPFEEELGDNTAPSKGLGIHGLPWRAIEGGDLQEDPDSLGKYESDGCIRLTTDDVEELFSIIITKPTVIEIVKGFQNAKLPGVEAR